MTKIKTKTRNVVQKQKQLEMDLRVKLTESEYEAMKTVAEASGDTLEKWLHTCVLHGIESDIDLYYGKMGAIRDVVQKDWCQMVNEELTIEELMDPRVILISFMADKEAQKKIPSLESRAPKLWSKVDRMYKSKRKEN